MFGAVITYAASGTIVKFWTTSKHQPRRGHIAATVVMVSLWVALYALEALPDLHRLLHEDAQSPAHNCLVTQFQHQLGPSISSATTLPTLPEVSSDLPSPVRDFQFLPSYDHRLSPSRAPPVA